MEHILSLSYGKDSLACLGAIEKLGWPLDRIVHSEVWATDTIPADLPPMIEFKKKADAIIKKRWGIEVEHVWTTNADGSKRTYEKCFYHVPQRRTLETNPNCRAKQGDILGFPLTKLPWCNGWLKMPTIRKGYTDSVHYIGIAMDEPKRFRHFDERTKSPLVALCWDEAYCRKWCEENDLLSPIYTTSARVGCWFCQNQNLEQLRLLRKNYSDLWALLLKWDSDSPHATFHTNNITVHDIDKRFQMEEQGLVPMGRKFRWSMIKTPPKTIQLNLGM